MSWSWERHLWFPERNFKKEKCIYLWNNVIVCFNYKAYCFLTRAHNVKDSNTKEDWCGVVHIIALLSLKHPHLRPSLRRHGIGICTSRGGSIMTVTLCAYWVSHLYENFHIWTVFWSFSVIHVFMNTGQSGQTTIFQLISWILCSSKWARRQPEYCIN